jgi:hypothetical protein
LPFARFAFAMMVAAAASTAAGCGWVLGIDDGKPYPPDGAQLDAPLPDSSMRGEGGSDGSGGGDADVAIVDSAGDAADTTTAGDDSSPPDAGADALADAPADVMPDAPATDGPVEGCSPDLTFCQNRCKPGTDSCGVLWNCTGTCAPGEGCAPDGTCICVSDPNWCNNRCGMTMDNCGKMVDCGGCSGGAMCTNGACGCTAETTAQACGSNQCGSVTNNCTQTVNCGVNGTTGCAAGQECTTSGGVSTCCQLGTCAGRCNVQISDNCGGTLTCPSNGCPAGQECDLSTTACCSPTNNCGNQCNVSVSDGCGRAISCSCASGVCTANNLCCVPNGTCSGNCLDNCGQQSQACCGGMDAGKDDGPPMCLGQGLMCGPSVTEPCCPGLSCLAAIVPFIVPFSGGGPDGPILPDTGLGMTCQ